MAELASMTDEEFADMRSRMGRNYLKGVICDILNPMISAIGLNLRLLGNFLSKATILRA